MNPDFLDMLSALNEARAEYMVVGAYAVAVHGRPRATGDLDIWVRPTSENASRVWAALEEFGAPLLDLTLEDLSAPELVFQIGIAPSRIDLLTSVSGVEFAEAWPNRIRVPVSGITIDVIGREDLLRNKRALGRPRDLADIADIETADDAE